MNYKILEQMGRVKKTSSTLVATALSSDVMIVKLHDEGDTVIFTVLSELGDCAFIAGALSPS